jgi:hypothetical protein
VRRHPKQLILLADGAVEFGIFARQFALSIRQLAVQTCKRLYDTSVVGRFTAFIATQCGEGFRFSLLSTPSPS